jgi:hypothetical protein
MWLSILIDLCTESSFVPLFSPFRTSSPIDRPIIEDKGYMLFADEYSRCETEFWQMSTARSVSIRLTFSFFEKEIDDFTFLLNFTQSRGLGYCLIDSCSEVVNIYHKIGTRLNFDSCAELVTIFHTYF